MPSVRAPASGRRRRRWLEGRVRARGPVEHLDRHHRERREQPSNGRTAAASPVNGNGGRKAMNVSAPMVMMGAVSPMARDRPMITPVRMPGMPIGEMWSLHDLPLGRAAGVGALANRLRDRAQRLARRDDHDRQDQQRQRQARRQDALPEAEAVDEQAERQQAVDDRRHAGEVGDVDLDEVGEPVLARVLLEVDRRWRRPAGRRTSAVTSITSSEPTQAERMPACPARRDGKLVKNSGVRRGKPSIGHVDEQRDQREDADAPWRARPTTPKITSQRFATR